LNERQSFTEYGGPNQPLIYAPKTRRNLNYGSSDHLQSQSITYFARYDIFVFSGIILMKLGTHVRHASGHCWTGFQGQRSKVKVLKVMTRPINLQWRRQTLGVAHTHHIPTAKPVGIPTESTFTKRKTPVSVPFMCMFSVFYTVHTICIVQYNE